ncbi:hypothetical protein [Sphingomonas sp.]|uniref:hypothetical protein n=1 Tax=Sphingomonas sp. TaxID=28214 RepID=UPI001B161EB3|nr:hypothetical protein [Sphingomonas sp.]MBO9711294.1 hypothetical protein [Sphingomonas sp.]
MIRGLAATTALALLAGCNVETSSSGSGMTNVTTVVDTDNGSAPATGAPAQGKPQFLLAEDGIWVTLPDKRNQRASFGAARDIAVQIVGGALGAPTAQGTNSECGAGPLDNVDFAGGLTLFFQDGKFVGWNVDGRDGSPHRLPNGTGIGATLAQLRDKGDVAVQDTSLGTEITMGEVGGLVTGNTPEGKLTDFWAGTTCAFR